MPVIKACLIAFGTYSKLPVPYFEWKEKDMEYSVCFFPFVGLFLGAAEWCWLCICNKLGIGNLAEAAFVIILNIFITGGIHIDGYMDTMDALHSYQPQDKKLQILKDAHIGAFSVIMFLVYILVYVGALSEINYNIAPLLACTFVFSRILSGFSVVTFKGAKKEGMLYTFSKSANKNIVCTTLVVEFLLVTTVMVYFYRTKAAVIVCGMLAVFLYYRYKSYKEFGGITGDLAGWFLCLCEMAGAVICAIL
ncbi:MAG: adenosylcobinamide-GDP ribazoletransferase [Lachnospiraceae bacterium]|nr:adenosylcobinamide-GDP ribazoletransferase [Lachnospiraceae bacterium]